MVELATALRAGFDPLFSFMAVYPTSVLFLSPSHFFFVMINFKGKLDSKSTLLAKYSYRRFCASWADGMLFTNLRKALFVTCKHLPTVMNRQNPLIQQLKKYGPMSPEAEKSIEQKINRIVKKKNDHFLKQGQLLTSYFVVHKGVFRAYWGDPQMTDTLLCRFSN